MGLSSDRRALLRAELARRGLAAPRASELPRRADPTRAPLSFAQERLFFLELYEPGTALYNDAVLVRVDGELDLERLTHAFAAVQARHEILRTSFELAGDGPEQRVDPTAPLPLVVQDLTDRPDARAHGRAIAAEDARTPFDLERGPVWRARLARVDEREWLLAVTMHHIVSDGASMGLLFDELSALYARNELAPLPPPLAVQFGDYAAWERATLDERKADADLDWWRRALAGPLSVLDFAASGGEATHRGGFVRVDLDAPLLARLREFARVERATTNDVLLATWFALLGAVHGVDDVRTGVASSLRRRPELEPLIGFFVQTLVLRPRIAGDPDFRALVAGVRGEQLAVGEHTAVPFERVARALEQARLDRPALLPTFFSHMRDAIRAPAFPGARTSWEFVDPLVARFGLALVVHESGDALTGFLEYDAGLIAPDVAERVATSWTALLGRALARPESRLAELTAGCDLAVRSAPRRSILAFPRNLRRAAGS